MHLSASAPRSEGDLGPQRVMAALCPPRAMSHRNRSRLLRVSRRSLTVWDPPVRNHGSRLTSVPGRGVQHGDSIS